MKKIIVTFLSNDDADSFVKIIKQMKEDKGGISPLQQGFLTSCLDSMESIEKEENKICFDLDIKI